MLNKFILNAIDNVQSIKDFNDLLNKWELSNAPKEVKEEAIRVLKAKKSLFYINPKVTPESVYNDIVAGSADIDDIN